VRFSPTLLLEEVGDRVVVLLSHLGSWTGSWTWLMYYKIDGHHHEFRLKNFVLSSIQFEQHQPLALQFLSFFSFSSYRLCKTLGLGRTNLSCDTRGRACESAGRRKGRIRGAEAKEKEPAVANRESGSVGLGGKERRRKAAGRPSSYILGKRRLACARALPDAAAAASQYELAVCKFT